MLVLLLLCQTANLGTNATADLLKTRRRGRTYQTASLLNALRVFDLKGFRKSFKQSESE